ncbi:MAG: helix-turn-helix transcriptional regulator [Clostridia bacterium]|nr:helix-turn-helix transcriptional regulator [Clostridia bacterium]
MNKKKVTEVFAERLKELREDNKVSLKKLGEAIGVSDIAISRWENLKRIPNIEVLSAIADYFAVSTDFLLGKKDD